MGPMNNQVVVRRWGERNTALYPTGFPVREGVACPVCLSLGEKLQAWARLIKVEAWYVVDTFHVGEVEYGYRIFTCPDGHRFMNLEQTRRLDEF